MQCREMCSNLMARAKWDHLGTLIKVQYAGKHSLRLAECKCYSAGMAGTGEGLQNHKWPTPQCNRQAAPNPISNYNAAFVKTNKATLCMTVANYWTCSWPPTATALLEISREENPPQSFSRPKSFSTATWQKQSSVLPVASILLTKSH